MLSANNQLLEKLNKIAAFYRERFGQVVLLIEQPPAAYTSCAIAVVETEAWVYTLSKQFRQLDNLKKCNIKRYKSFRLPKK